MSFYSVLEVTPSKEDWIPDYLPTANKLVGQYGGKYLSCTARSSDHYLLIKTKDDFA